MQKKKLLAKFSTTATPHHRFGKMLLVILICAAFLVSSISNPDGFFATTAQSFAQSTSSVFGIEANPLSSDRGADFIPQTKTSWVRGPVVLWKDLELTEGVYNWTNLSEVVAELQLAQTNGYEPIVVVTGTPAWAQKYEGHTCGPIQSTKFKAFGDFMVELITNSPLNKFNIKYWELWNEPDVSWDALPLDYTWYGCWGEKTDTNYYGGGYYGDMLKIVTPRIKGANPQAQVLVGGLLLDCDPDNPPDDPLNPGSKKDCTSSKFLEGILINGGPSSFDGVSYHAYDYYGGPGIYGNPNWNTAWDQGGSSLVPKARYIQNVLNKHNAANKYLLNTENAILCDDCLGNAEFEKTKAYYLAESYASSIAKGLKANIWFSLRGEWGRNNGLLEIKSGAYSPLPAFDAYQFAADELNGVSYVGPVTSFAGVRGHEFSKGDHHVWMMWSVTGGDVEVDLKAAPLAIYDVDGDPVTASGQQLTITRQPYYVELPASLPRLNLAIISKVFIQTIGAFETGQGGWTFANKGLPAGLVSSHPYDPTTGGVNTSIPSGSSSALLGNPDYPCSENGMPIGYAEIRRTLTLAKHYHTKTFLEFDYIIFSQDLSSSSDYDRFEVYIQDPGKPVPDFSDGNLVPDLACKWYRVPGNQNPRDGKQDGWAVGSIDVSAYQGQTITIYFQNHSRYDHWYNTYTYLDNIRLREVPSP